MEEKKVTSVIAGIEKTLSELDHNPILLQQYAWWILQSITKKSKIKLLTQTTITLTVLQEETIKTWLDLMINEDMPLQYLLGSVPFCDLDILVEPPVLIPRPETEEWTACLIEKLIRLEHKKITILDICSGSGCIGLALAQALPQATVIALDISDKAIAMGKKNATHNKINNITFVQSDLFNEMATDKLFDLVVSNPPYISFNDFQDLDPSVTTWEDPQALVAADEGKAIINAIIEQAPDYLSYNQEMAQKKVPQVILEIGYTQGPKVALFMKKLGYTDVQVHKDIEGKDRWVTGRVSNVAMAQES